MYILFDNYGSEAARPFEMIILTQFLSLIQFLPTSQMIDLLGEILQTKPQGNCWNH